MHHMSLHQAKILIATLTIISVTPTVSLAQDPPAATFQPGPWQPVDRVVPGQRVQVQVINQAGSILEYGTTDPLETVIELMPGSISQFQVTTLPVFININTIERSSLKFDLSTDDTNTIVVRITKINDVVGDRTLNIDDTGAIYIY